MTEQQRERASAVEALRALELTLEQARTSAARRLNLPVTDLLLLFGLARAGGSAMAGELGAGLDIQSGSLTGRLDRLEAAGLIARAVNPHDRRSVLIRLSDVGARELARMDVDLANAVQQVADGPLLEEFVATVLTLTTAITTRSGGASRV